jgi:hypothetical protein
MGIITWMIAIVIFIILIAVLFSPIIISYALLNDKPYEGHDEVSW